MDTAPQWQIDYAREQERRGERTLEQVREPAKLLNSFLQVLLRVWKEQDEIRVDDPKILFVEAPPSLGRRESVLGGGGSTLLDGIQKYRREGETEKKQDIVIGEIVIGSTHSTEGFIKVVNRISNNGLGIFLFHGYSLVFENQKKNQNLRTLLSKEDVFVNAILNLPEDFLGRISSSNAILVIVSKTKTDLEYIAEFEDWNGNSTGQFDAVVSNLFKLITDSKNSGVTVESRDQCDDLWTGGCIDPEQFHGFQHWTLQKALDYFESDFLNFKRHKLKEVVKDIRLARYNQKFTARENTFYMPLIGPSACVTKINTIAIKHQNCAQILVNEEIVLPEYLTAFLNSDIGEVILATEKSKGERLIPKLNKIKIKNIEIAIPPMKVQKEIVVRLSKVSLIMQKVGGLLKNISINPVSSDDDVEKVESILEIVEGLTEQERIHKLIRNGESKVVEFKETLSLDVKKQTKEHYIEDEALKTVVAFLNSDGGDLLIGVKDDGSITGTEKEMKKFYNATPDKYLLHLNNLIKHKIGEQYYPLVNPVLLRVDRNTVCNIRCSRSKKEVFYKDKEFYVRTNPATGLLEGRKVYEYIQNNFS